LVLRVAALVMRSGADARDFTVDATATSGGTSAALYRVLGQSAGGLARGHPRRAEPLVQWRRAGSGCGSVRDVTRCRACNAMQPVCPCRRTVTCVVKTHTLCCPLLVCA
jgi:hypothetical protein